MNKAYLGKTWCPCIICILALESSLLNIRWDALLFLKPCANLEGLKWCFGVMVFESATKDYLFASGNRKLDSCITGYSDGLVILSILKKLLSFAAFILDSWRTELMGEASGESLFMEKFFNSSLDAFRRWTLGFRCPFNMLCSDYLDLVLLINV